MLDRKHYSLIIKNLPSRIKYPFLLLNIYNFMDLSRKYRPPKDKVKFDISHKLIKN